MLNIASYGKGSTLVLKVTDESSNQFSESKIILRPLVILEREREREKVKGGNIL